MLTFTDGTEQRCAVPHRQLLRGVRHVHAVHPGLARRNNNFKFGGQYIYSHIKLPDQTDMNGRFAFWTDRVVQRQRSVNVSGAAVHPRAIAERHPDADERRRDVRAGQVAPRDLTLNLGVRYDLEKTPINNAFNPLFASADVYASTRTTSRRGSASPGTRAAAPSRSFVAATGFSSTRSRFGRPRRSSHRACTARRSRRSFPTARPTRARAGARCRPIRCWSTGPSSTARCSIRCFRPGRWGGTPAPSTSTTPIGSSPTCTRSRLATNDSCRSRWPRRSTTFTAGTGISSSTST